MTILFYLILYLLIIYITLSVSKRLELYDSPDERKIHTGKIINTSGVSLYIYLLFVITLNELSYDIEKIITVGIFVVIIGFIDDRKSINAFSKIILLIFPIFFLINSGLILNDLGQYELLGTVYLNKFNLVFTILACGLLINAFNYIDGVDGLLISTTIVSISYAILLLTDDKVINLLILILIPLIVNLFFNFLPANNINKIFMGDAGSLFIGFFISFLMIYLYKIQNIHPAYLIWMCWYPVYDFLSVTIIRIIKKTKFYLPDNLHLHNDLLKLKKNNHYKVTMAITFINILITIVGFATTKYFGYIFSLIIFNLFFVFFLFLRCYFNGIKFNRR